MNIKKILLISLLPIMLFSGCISAVQKKNNQVTYLVGLESAEIKSGRFDLAAKTNDNLERLIPVKKAPVIKSLTEVKNGKTNNVVVLPSDNIDEDIVNDNTVSFNNIVNSSATNKSEERRDENIIKDSDEKTTQVIAAVEYAKEHPNHGYLYWIFHIGSYLGIVGILALGVCCFLFPAVLPIVIGIFKDLYDVLSFLLGYVASFIKRK